MEDDLNGKNISMEETSMDEDLKEALQEDDNSLFGTPILYWDLAQLSPSLFLTLSHPTVSDPHAQQMEFLMSIFLSIQI